MKLSKLIREHFDAVEAKDVKAVLAFYDDDIDFIDPHYPKVHMKGKGEVFKGLTWSFKGVKSFSFNTTNYFENEEGTSASIEYACQLELSHGQKLDFSQVFIIEMQDGKIKRLQAYETYGPHGMHNIMLIVTRFIHKITRY